MWTGHADFNSPFETISFLRSINQHDLNIMLESKMKDLALLRLRKDPAKYALDRRGGTGLMRTNELKTPQSIFLPAPNRPLQWISVVCAIRTVILVS